MLTEHVKARDIAFTQIPSKRLLPLWVDRIPRSL